jgi:ABC-type multidrug transport system fused ATPase/permease subunit
VRENLEYALAVESPKKKSSDKAFWEALKKAQAYDFIKKMENGLDTEI